VKHQFENFFSNSREYVSRRLVREIFAWYRIGRYYAAFLPLIIIGLVALYAYIRPDTPKVAYLAIGQQGSSYGLMADKFKTEFQSVGVSLQLIETEGLAQGLVALDDPKSKVNASFLTAGSASAAEYPNLVSLGSFQYAPIWLFIEEI